MSATGNGFTERSFTFLQELEDNNNREWFNNNKKTFLDHVQEPFQDLLHGISQRLADSELVLKGGPATIFRMNRDVRFSKDKRPYKTSLSGLLTPDGTKAENGGLAYLEFSATGGMIAGGFHQPTVPQLTPIRERILNHPREFDSVLDSLRAAGLELDTTQTTKTMPRAFATQADHPHADVIRLKQLVAASPLPKAAWLDDTVAQRITDTVRGLTPLIQFGIQPD